MPPDNRLQLTMPSVTVCGCARTAPVALAGEPNVRHTLVFLSKPPFREEFPVLYLRTDEVDEVNHLW